MTLVDKPGPRQAWESDDDYADRVRAWQGAGRSIVQPNNEEAPRGNEGPVSDQSTGRTNMATVTTAMEPREAFRKINLREGEATPEEKIWAEMHLRDMPVLVSFHATKKAHVWLSNDGDYFHQAGYVVASPGDPNRFRIWLYQGATQADLAWFERLVEDARNGRFLRFGWEANKDGDSVYSFRRDRRVKGPNDDELTRWILEECTDPACEDSYHERWSVEESAYRHNSFTTVTDDYQVNVARWDDGDDQDWRVDVTCDATLLPAQLGSFLSDLQWAQAEAAKLNATRRALAHRDAAVAVVGEEI